MVLQSPLKTVWSFFTLATSKYLKVHTVLLMDLAAGRGGTDTSCRSEIDGYRSQCGNGSVESGSEAGIVRSFSSVKTVVRHQLIMKLSPMLSSAEYILYTTMVL